MRARVRLTLIRFALVLASLLVSLLICEWTVRRVSPQVLGVPWSEEVNGIFTFKPNVRGRYAIPGAFDTMVSINSQRFRAQKDFERKPSSGRLRIAVLGDSFTFGEGANDHETYPAQLEQILSSRMGPGRVEVINAGVLGMGTAEEAVYYDLWVKQFHPHLVILSVFWNDVDNDFHRNLFFLDATGKVVPRGNARLSAEYRRLQWIGRLANALPGYAYLAQHSHLLNLLRRLYHETIVRRLQVTSADDAGVNPSANEFEYFRREGPRFLAGEVSWLRDRVEESGARLAVVFVPARESVYPSDLASDEARQKSAAIIRVLAEVCARKEIPFADLTAEIRQRVELLRQPLFYDPSADLHPTPLGYRAMAEAVADFLTKDGVVPTTPAPKVSPHGGPVP